MNHKLQGVLTEISDNRKGADGMPLVGTKFQLSMIIESISDPVTLNMSEPSGEAFFEGARSVLLKSFDDVGFNYFDRKYVPDDLDTASVFVRNFSSIDRVVDEFRRIEEENVTSDGCISTWLDTSDHQYWCSGDKTDHIDVLLNYWLTKISLGDQLDYDLVLKHACERGLINYWYLPSLYSAFMYSKFLTKVGLSKEEKYVEPLKRTMDCYLKDRNAWVSKSNNCKIDKVRNLIKSRMSEKIDNLLHKKILFTIGWVDCEEEINNYLSQYTIDKEQNIYWSLGFTPYRSEYYQNYVLLQG